MEPVVRYVTTSDGVRIAYTVTGEGPPLVFWTEPAVSHVQLEWEQPLFGKLMRKLASRNTLIRFDQRGTGLSDRVHPDPLPDGGNAYLRDFEAVINRLGLERFSLAAVQAPTLAAIEYIAANPAGVDRFVVVNGFLRSADFASTPVSTALMAAAQADFVLVTETIGTVAFGPSREETREYGAYIRSCIDATFFTTVPFLPGRDVRKVAESISTPTLVLKHAAVQYVTDDMARSVAATIPGAQYSVVPGGWADDIEGLADRIVEFVNAGRAATVTPPSRTASQSGAPVTIVFTDVERNTELLTRLGDDAWRGLLREHERITREQLKTYAGAEIKTIGDAFMASFASATQAVECAIALQRAFAGRNTAAEHPLLVRIGINVGEPIAEDGDLFGTSVTIASRIAGSAAGGEIVTANVVRELVAGKGFLFADRGDVVLRGFEDPVRLYEVRWQETG